VYKVLNSAATLIQRTTTEAPQGHMYYIGLDVHKKTISYCVKDASGQVHQEGQVGATRWELDDWMKTLPQPWTVAMEATIFTGWIYDHLLPHAQQVKVAHPLMLRAIAAAKKKNDRIDAGKIADCLRCDFLPECHMASTSIRDRRRTLRYRHLLVRQMVQMKNRISGLLMETGVSHNKRRLHNVGYFRELLDSNEEVNESIRPLLRLSRDTIVATAENGICAGQFATARPSAGRADQTSQNGSWSRTDHCVDLGIRNGRCFPFPFDPRSHQLLRALRG
jgi:transposase